MIYLLFIPSLALIVAGIMYITGKGSAALVSDAQIEEDEIVEYIRKRNPRNNRIFFGIMMILLAVYLALIALGAILKINLIIFISTIVAVIVAFVCAIYYYTSKTLIIKENPNGRNKNVKN